MSETRYIVAGNFIDGSGADMRRNVFLEVSNFIIASIGPASDLPRDLGALIDNFSHCTIVPPLVDCSVFLARSPAVDMGLGLPPGSAGFKELSAAVRRHIYYCHTHGVLGAAENEDLSNLQALFREGIIDTRIPASACRPEQDEADCSSTTGDFLKIDYSGNIETGVISSGPGYDFLCSLLKQKGGKKAVVVANGRQKVEEAIAAGCDAIEQGYLMGEENLEKMADRGILWIPSVLRAKNALVAADSSGNVCCRFSTRYVAPGKHDPAAKASWEKMLDEQLRQLHLARKLGVKTAVGSGAGSGGILHGESVAEEMKLFIKAGYSLEETIRSASETGAEFFGMQKLGALVVGQPATFLLTRGTVQQLPRKLSYLENIYVDGSPSSSYRKNPVKET